MANEHIRNLPILMGDNIFRGIPRMTGEEHYENVPRYLTVEEQQLREQLEKDYPKLIEYEQMDLKLKEAATSGDVNYLIRHEDFKSWPYFCCATDKGHTIFHIAVRFRRTAFLRKVIEMLPGMYLEMILTFTESSLNWNPLHFAAFQGSLREIQLILNAYGGGGSIVIRVYEEEPWLAKDKYDRTPLHLLLRKPAADDVEECGLQMWSTRKKELCEMEDTHGMTPFLLAVRQGFYKIALEMFEYSSRFFISNRDGLNPLHILAEKSEVGALEEKAWSLEKLLIKSRPELLQVKCENGQSSTILHTWARKNKLLQLAEVTVHHGLSLLQKLSASKDSKGNTPVHIAIECGNQDFALFLVKRCGELNPPIWRYANSNGITPFEIALRTHQEIFVLRCVSLDPMTFIKPISGEDSPLFIAVKGGMDEVVQKVCSFVLFNSPLWNIPTMNKDGETVLHVALNCTENTGTLLVKTFAHLIQVVDKNGKKPFDVAAEVCVKWLIELLLIMDPYALQSSPKAWVKSCKLGDLETIKLFAKDPSMVKDLCTEHKDSPLHHIRLDHEEAYEKFFAISPIWEMKNYCDSDGKTPLHRALERKDIIFVELLLKKGVDSNIKDTDGTTAKNLLADLSVQLYEWHKMCERVNINPRLQTRYIQDRSALGKIRDTLAVVAALLATLTFAAGFTLPGGLNQDTGESLKAKKASFLVFILADAYALCSSMLVLFCLIWSMVCDEVMSHVLIDRSVLALIHSFVATLVAFMTGIYTVISKKSLWASIVIIVMVSFVAVISWDKTVLYNVLDELIPSKERNWKKEIKSLRQIPKRVAIKVKGLFRLFLGMVHNYARRDDHHQSSTEEV